MYRSWYSNTVLFFIKNNVGLLGYFFQLTKRREECAEECIKCININRWREYYFLAIQPAPCNASARSVWSPRLVILVMFCHTFGVYPYYTCGHLVIYINACHLFNNNTVIFYVCHLFNTNTVIFYVFTFL